MIKIKAKKIINLKGEKCYKLIDFNMLPKDQLPKAYLDASHNCYKEDDSFLLTSARLKASKDYQDDCMICSIDNSFLEEDWNEIIRDIRISGNILQKINNDLKRQRKAWHGELTYKI